MEKWAQCKSANMNVNGEDDELSQNMGKVDNDANQKNGQINDKDLTQDNKQIVVTLNETVCKAKETFAQESEILYVSGSDKSVVSLSETNEMPAGVSKNLKEICASQENPCLESHGDESDVDSKLEYKNECSDGSVVSLSEIREIPSGVPENLNEICASQGDPGLEDNGDESGTDSESEYENESSDGSVVSLNEIREIPSGVPKTLNEICASQDDPGLEDNGDESGTDWEWEYGSEASDESSVSINEANDMPAEVSENLTDLGASQEDPCLQNHDDGFDVDSELEYENESSDGSVVSLNEIREIPSGVPENLNEICASQDDPGLEDNGDESGTDSESEYENESSDGSVVLLSESKKMSAEESENLKEICVSQEDPCLQDHGDESGPDSVWEYENEASDESSALINETNEIPAEVSKNFNDLGASREDPGLQDHGDESDVDSKLEYKNECSDRSVVSLSEIREIPSGVPENLNEICASQDDTGVEDNGDESGTDSESEYENESSDGSVVLLSKPKKMSAEESENLNKIYASQEDLGLEDDCVEADTDSELEYENKSSDGSVVSLSETKKIPANVYENLDEIYASQEDHGLEDDSDEYEIDADWELESEPSDESIISLCDSDDSVMTQLELEALISEEVSDQEDITIDTSILKEKQVNIDVATVTMTPNLSTCDQSSVDIVEKAFQAIKIVEDYDSKENTKDNFKTPTRKTKIRICQLEGLHYLDLSKDVVKEFATTPISNQVDNDETFKSHLDKFLGNPNHKRRLYTMNIYGDNIGSPMENETKSDKTVSRTSEIGTVVTKIELPSPLSSPLSSPLPSPTGTVSPRHASFSANAAMSLMQRNILAINACSLAANMNEHMKLIQSELIIEPQNEMACRRHKYVLKYCIEYDLKFSFLISLDNQSTPKFMCHPDAIRFYNNFNEYKEHVAVIIYDIINHKVFNCGMKVGILWNKNVTQLSHCVNTTKADNRRYSNIELSDALTTCANTLIVALAHEMCHAAAWLYAGEFGHGDICKAWILRLRQIMPEIPSIEDCGRTAHLYTYYCPLCEAKSQGSFEVTQYQDNVRCFYCFAPIQIGKANSKRDDPLKNLFKRNDLTSFALFIKKNYRSMMANTDGDQKHSEIMHALSEKYNSQ